MTEFWVIAGGMVVAALAFILPPLLRGGAVASTDETRDLNIELFRARMQELEADLESGRIRPEQLDAARADLEQELLYDVSGGESAGLKEGRLGGRLAAAVLTLAIPVAALGLYWQLGASRLIPALQASASSPPATKVAAAGGQRVAQGENAVGSVEEMVATLAQRLEVAPEDAQGWQMLARSYVHLQRYGEAVEAFGNALRIGGENPDVMTGLAEAIAFANNNRLTKRPVELLDRSLQLQPNHTRALWLRGFAHFQSNEFELAIERWQRVASTLPPDSREAEDVVASIREARERLGQPGEAQVTMAETQPADTGGTGSPALVRGAPSDSDAKDESGTMDGKSIVVRVEIDEQLFSQVEPNDTVFVFARSVDGPRMPAAIVRRQVRDVPFTVTLDDSMSMSPSMKLSQFPQVTLNARVSSTGNAMRQSGDIEGVVTPVQPGTPDAVVLRINTVIQ